MRADHRRLEADIEQLKKEEDAIKAAVAEFNRVFATLEGSLSGLLYATLNLRNSQVAYAIYFSPTSFDARAELVKNALIQIASENKELQCLIEPWKRIKKNIDSTRNLRNALAHGIQTTFSIGGKRYSRFSPLFSDVTRIGPSLAKRQIPGLGSQDIFHGTEMAKRTLEHVGIANRIMVDFFDGAPTWRKRFDVLTESLKKPLSP